MPSSETAFWLFLNERIFIKIEDVYMSFGVINSELLKGFLENIELFSITLLFALPLGLIIAFGSMSQI